MAAAGRRRAWLCLAVAAGAVGLALLAGCLYYLDRRRRSAPGFRRRLRERRRKEYEKAKERAAELHNLRDTAKLQEFFLQEIELGEHWLARGEHKKSIEHLANAIVVCTDPNKLIEVLEETLPPHVFETLMGSIPYTVQRLETIMNAQDSTAH